MAVEVKQWMAKDGTLFCEKRDAEEHERYVEKIEFIEKSLDVDFDLFMGSGTTGVACKNLDRKFIGIEMDEGYFNVAKDRLLCK